MEANHGSRSLREIDAGTAKMAIRGCQSLNRSAATPASHLLRMVHAMIPFQQVPAGGDNDDMALATDIGLGSLNNSCILMLCCCL